MNYADNDDDTVSFLDWLQTHVFVECFSDKFKRVISGGGCHTLDVADDKLIYYYVLGSFESKSTGKKRKCKAQVPLIWSIFKLTYIEKLEEYLFHRYIKEWQEKQRNIISTRMNNHIALPENALFGSFDYGGNVVCGHKKHPQGSIVELSIMVIYEIMNIDGRLRKNTICMMSNESNHGWYSAVLVTVCI